MRSLGAVATGLLLVIAACATSRPAPEAPAAAVDVEERGAGQVKEPSPVVEEAPSIPQPPAAPAPEPPPPPNPVPVEGEGALLALLGAAAPATVDMGAFDIACLAHPRALIAPKEADRSLDEVAREQGVTLGQLLLVRIERDPARARERAPLRVCRPVSPEAELYAPLFREKERAGRWVVAKTQGNLLEDLRRLLGSAEARGKAPADRPRALVVEDRVVLLALPLLGDATRQGE